MQHVSAEACRDLTKNVESKKYNFFQIKKTCTVDEYVRLVYVQLLDRNPATRLGMPNSPHGPIRDHPFFRSIDWQKLETRKLDPPFKPKLVGR